MATFVGKQAVVVGAGIGGLAAARVLSDHYERVSLFESDHLSDVVRPRPGTPQSPHLHVLLGGGLRALVDLFPDFDQKLAKAGAVPIKMSQDYHLDRPGFHPFPQRDLGLLVYGASRPLVEHLVRQQVSLNQNIEILDRSRVLEFLPSTDSREVSAITFQRGSGQIERLSADLFVDASGHGLLTLALLESINSALPGEKTIGIDMGYATAVFEMPKDVPGEWKAAVTHPHPPGNRRGAFLYPTENQTWTVTISGRYEDKPPDDETGFFDHLRSLPTQTIYDAVKMANRHDGIKRYGLKASRWRQFEKLDSAPSNLIPFGDTICRFNPVYGQGMSVAAQEACLLRHLLTSDIQTLRKRFLDAAALILATPWATAAVPDFLDPRTEGTRPADLEASLQFSTALFEVAAADTAVHKLMLEVQHLLKPRDAYKELNTHARFVDMTAYR